MLRAEVWMSLLEISTSSFLPASIFQPAASHVDSAPLGATHFYTLHISFLIGHGPPPLASSILPLLTIAAQYP